MRQRTTVPMNTSTAAIWLSTLVAALALIAAGAGLFWQGMAIIVPAVFLAGVLILRRHPLGYLIAFPLLVREAMLAPMIVAQTVSQILSGWSYSTGEIVGPITGFVILALVAIWVIVAILRNVSKQEPSPAAPPLASQLPGILPGCTDAEREDEQWARA